MRILAPATLLLALSTAARADEACFGASVPLQTTSYATGATIPKFHPALGTLTAVRIELSATIVGDPAVETQDPVPSQSVLVFCADVQVQRPDTSSIGVTVPVIQFIDSLSAYDGTLDFAGTSGVTHPGATATSVSVTNLTSPLDLALFSGPLGGFDTITLPLGALNTAFAVGPGPLLVSTPQQASIDLRVCYEYAPFLARFCAGDGSGTACPCGNTSALGAFAGCVNSSGAGARLVASGYPSVVADAVVLTCSDVPVGAPVMFFQGTTRSQGGAGAVFGDGLACASGTITRLATRFATFGVANYPSAGDPALSVAGSVTGGDVRTYQVWHRDALTFCASAFYNLTNGVEISWQ